MKPMKLIIIAVLLGGLALLWFVNRRAYPIDYGISFSHHHAAWLGLDWKETYLAMLNDLQPASIRISAPWDDIEHEQEKFYFDDIDWQMDQAKARGTKVILVIGQKAPRWPECHVPVWIERYPAIQGKAQLLNYIKAIVNRYQDHPALEFWQVENEPFIRFVFGDCRNFHLEYTDDEVALTKKLDPIHQIIITDSGELGTWRRASQLGDYLGTTLYRVVRLPHGGIWTYDWLPALHYRWKAGLLGTGVARLFVSELQAEPWFANGTPQTTPIVEQEETMNPERMKKNIEYARHIGAPRAYLWGIEWWYWMKTVKGDARYWDIAKDVVMKSSQY